MPDLSNVAAGWEVWNEEVAGRIVLAYRPDIFNATRFPPSCLPTISVAPGSAPNEPPERRAQSSNWYTALYLEPDVLVNTKTQTFPDRDEAANEAISITQQFVNGDIDYWGAYMHPREAYLNKLDELLEQEINL